MRGRGAQGKTHACQGTATRLGRPRRIPGRVCMRVVSFCAAALSSGCAGRKRYKKSPSFLSIHMGVKADVLPKGEVAGCGGRVAYVHVHCLVALQRSSWLHPVTRCVCRCPLLPQPRCAVQTLMCTTYCWRRGRTWRNRAGRCLCLSRHCECGAGPLRPSGGVEIICLFGAETKAHLVPLRFPACVCLVCLCVALIICC